MKTYICESRCDRLKDGPRSIAHKLGFRARSKGDEFERKSLKDWVKFVISTQLSSSFGYHG